MVNIHSNKNFIKLYPPIVELSRGSEGEAQIHANFSEEMKSPV